jgi:hypothetical protein
VRRSAGAATALPRLAVRFGLARASLLLGFIWACWHLPLFFLPAVDQYGQSFPMFVLGGIALSVAITQAAAIALYQSLRFGREHRALKIGGRYVDEEHMVLYLNSAGE